MKQPWVVSGGPFSSDMLPAPDDPIQTLEQMQQETAERAVRQLLQAINQDPDRPGLRDTPRRIYHMLVELCSREPFEFTTFDAEGMSELIVQTNIPFHSLCEHHMLPFVGTAAIGYIPKGKIVGLSKLARAVKWCAAGLQNQERITKAIADMLVDKLKPVGVGVVLRADHSCMSLRGVHAHGTQTTTSALRGVLMDEPSARAEFLSLAR